MTATKKSFDKEDHTQPSQIEVCLTQGHSNELNGTYGSIQLNRTSKGFSSETWIITGKSRPDPSRGE